MATICIEAIPTASHIGLDLHSWQSGPNFRGLRNVPAGLHCLHITIASIVTVKFAVWLSLKSGETIAYKWDKVTESLLQMDHTYALSGTGTSEMFLIECPHEDDREWATITSHLDTDAIAKMVPLGRCVTSTTSSNTDTSGEDLNHLGSTLSKHDEIEFQFLEIDLKRSWPAGAIGRQITEYSLDKSWLLKDIIQRAGSPNMLLNQFEFCFVGVLLYSSVTCFDQWNIILSVCCTAKAALVELSSFMSTLLAVLEAQMQQVSHELYGDIFSLTLPRHLNRLQSNIEECESGITDSLKDNLEVLLDHLSREFGAEQDDGQQHDIYGTGNSADEDKEDDEKPVIVVL